MKEITRKEERNPCKTDN